MVAIAPPRPHIRAMPTALPRRLLRTWLVIATIDGLFATTLNVVAYHSTAARLWQGVASTVLGPSAIGGGTTPVLVGLALHLGVALAWSAVFLALWAASPSVRRVVGTPAGKLGVAAVYGPMVWMMMSLAVVPRLTGKPPLIGVRWWVQLAGHIVFVALPIVVMVSRDDAPWPETPGRPAT